MGGGILKGGYMSLLVDGEGGSRRAVEEDLGDQGRKVGDGVEDREDEDCRAVTINEDGQTSSLFREGDPEPKRPEDDIDVLYELQGWVVIMIECPECKKYISIYSLPRHQFDHSKPKKEHPCDKCSKVFSRLNLLRNHERKHMEKPPKPKEEEKTFMCELCGDVFRKAKYLKNHQMRHEGNLPFVCKICGRRFLFQRQLKRHDVIHRDVKPILCQECGRGFVQRSQLNAHMRQHTGEKPYKCDLCERAFTHNVSLKTHKKRDHGVTVDKCSNPHVGRPKREGEGGTPKRSRSSGPRKSSQSRSQSVINTPSAAAQYQDCRMIPSTLNHMPLGLVINPDRQPQGLDLSMDSPDSPTSLDANQGMPSRPGERGQRERQMSSGSNIHNMDAHSHSRSSHGEVSHAGGLEPMGNPHMERSVLNMDRHGGGSGHGGGSASAHAHYERAMGMPLHLMDRQALSPPLAEARGGGVAHSHHMEHPHHQGGIPLIARPDLNQHLMRPNKKGKEMEAQAHQNNPAHPPYPWGAWGNVGDGMGMRFPVFPQ